MKSVTEKFYLSPTGNTYIWEGNSTIRLCTEAFRSLVLPNWRGPLPKRIAIEIQRAPMGPFGLTRGKCEIWKDAKVHNLTEGWHNWTLLQKDFWSVFSQAGIEAGDRFAATMTILEP